MEEKQVTGYPSIDRPWLKYYDAEFLTQSVPAMNIYTYLHTMTEKHDDFTALSYYGKQIPYKELFEHIDETAKILTGIGVRSGDRIMYLMPNIPETAYFLYGGARIGAIADYIDPRPDSIDFAVSAQKVLAMFREEKAKFLVALDQCYIAMLKPIARELQLLGVESIILVKASSSMDRKAMMGYMHEVIKFNGFQALAQSIAKTERISKLIKTDRKKSFPKLLDYEELIEENKNVTLPPVKYMKNQLAVIVHTSGTSSAMPKPIPLTHDNLNIYAHQTMGANMPMAVGDRALHILPYFAAYGIVDIVHAGLCHVNNLIEIPEFAFGDFGKLIKKYKPQIIIGAPSWFLALPKNRDLQNVDLSFLKMVTYGGDVMSADDEVTINAFLRCHNSKCILTKGHGMSETSGCASYATGMYNIPGSMGIPMPLTTYAIVDSETKEMLAFQEGQEYLSGELIISSDAVTSGILDGKVIVPHQDYHGKRYIFTRDIVQMDRNGIMTFLARSDRMITRFDGYKIKPYEVENIIKDYPGIQYCIISARYDDNKFGNVAIADIVLQDEKVLSREMQVALVEKIIKVKFIDNANVSSRQIPAYFRFRKSIPLTRNSKINYSALATEPFQGNEVKVYIEETNISVNKIVVS